MCLATSDQQHESIRLHNFLSKHVPLPGPRFSPQVMVVKSKLVYLRYASTGESGQVDATLCCSAMKACDQSMNPGLPCVVGSPLRSTSITRVIRSLNTWPELLTSSTSAGGLLCWMVTSNATGKASFEPV